MIESNFHMTDAEAILLIPLSRRHVYDSVFWMYNKNGAYSVKSGYHIARLISKEDNGIRESSEPMVGGQVWGKLWKLHVPNKIKPLVGEHAKISCQHDKIWLNEGL